MSRTGKPAGKDEILTIIESQQLRQSSARPKTHETGGPTGLKGKLERPELVFTDEVKHKTAAIYEQLKSVIVEAEWPKIAPYIAAINDLKAVRNAVILAHNYMTPDIFHGVADFSGDSLQLAKQAAKTDADVIVQCGVHFMAETAKILNPEKTVLIPDMEAGCSLAESITAEDVQALREAYPGVPIVTYVNTSAAVKAQCDICCTSANALQVVESLNADRVIMVPDKYLAQNVAAQTEVEIIAWEGRCEVHERFTAPQLRSFREAVPGLKIIAHPECPPEVLKEADFAGSTSGMIKWVENMQPENVMLVTECSMSDNVAVEHPDVKFIRPCHLCPHMQRITLPKILDSLLMMGKEVHVDPAIAAQARRSVERMISVTK